MRTKILIHLPNKQMRKFFDNKMAEMRYFYGSDSVLSTIWQYWNFKEDTKEKAEQQKSEARRQQELV